MQNRANRMVFFIDATTKDQVTQLADYMSQLMEDADADKFLTECARCLKAHDETGALKHIINNCAVLVDDEEEDIGCTFNVIVYTIQPWNDKDKTDSIRKLTAVLASLDDVEVNMLERLKVLVNIFNTLLPSPLKYETYLKIVEFAAASGQMEAIVGQLDYLDTWLADWNVTDEQKLSLYDLFQSSLFDCDKQELAMQMLQKYLTLAPAELTDTVRANALKYISSAISSTEVHDFFALMQLPTIQLMKGSPVFKAIELLTLGDIANYEKLMDSETSILTDLGLERVVFDRKMRVHALALLCASAPVVTFDQISSALRVDEAEVEPWVIEVIGLGLVDAKVDQVAKTVTVTQAKHKFDKDSWEELLYKLDEWHANIEAMSQSLDSVNAQVTRQASY
eukprot:m.353859 g.353859  ORF g.353859 m.353859 type:complete len:395 (-) comp16845_c0_seq1:257-1441(-)